VPVTPPVPPEPSVPPEPTMPPVLDAPPDPGVPPLPDAPPPPPEEVLLQAPASRSTTNPSRDGAVGLCSAEPERAKPSGARGEGVVGGGRRAGKPAQGFQVIDLK
jgi:hypothetical protein